MCHRYALQAKPHGHGDVHSLLLRSGLAETWLSEGRKYIVFFQVRAQLRTGGCVTLCATLTCWFVTGWIAGHQRSLLRHDPGHGGRECDAWIHGTCTAVCCVVLFDGSWHLASHAATAMTCPCQINTICTNRRGGDARGAIATLQSDGKDDRTVNVEYNQLDALLRETVNEDGDVDDPETGWSPFPGNTNQLVCGRGGQPVVVSRMLCSDAVACACDCAGHCGGPLCGHCQAYRGADARVCEPKVRTGVGMAFGKPGTSR